MDATGALALSQRMAQQEHWRQAEAVRDGRQPRVDPDGDALTQFGEGYRLYAFPSRGERLVCKRLVAGIWETDGLVDSADRVGGVQLETGRAA